ncbi:MAG: hypothetical protein ACLTMP_12910 [Eggerthella lenta]
MADHVPHYTFNDRRAVTRRRAVHEGTIHGAEATPDGLMQDRTLSPRELWDEAKGRG